MHECFECGMECDCDGEDHGQPQPEDCTHECDADSDADGIDDDESWVPDRTEAWWLREQDRLDRIEHATAGYWRRRREHRPRGGRQSKYVRGWRLYSRRYRGRHGDRLRAAREFPEAMTRALRAAELASRDGRRTLARALAGCALCRERDE